jgi:hypothetical protein
MKKVLAVLSGLVVLATSSVAVTSHFSLSATYEPPANGKGLGAVSVTFSPTDPDVKINEEPSPRLLLDPMQGVLDDKQPPPKTSAIADPEKIKALDLTQPVRFAVAPRAGAPKGEQTVQAHIQYFYCSKREGWCRKGKTAVEFSVKVH